MLPARGVHPNPSPYPNPSPNLSPIPSPIRSPKPNLNLSPSPSPSPSPNPNPNPNPNRTLTPTQVPARCTSWPDAPSGGGGGGGVGFATGLSLSSGSSDSFESDALSDVSGKVRSFHVWYYRHVIGMHYLLCLYCAYTVHPCTCTSLGQGIRWGDVHVLSRTKHVLPPESTHMQCTRLGKVPTRCRAPSWASSSPLPPPLHLHQ